MNTFINRNRKISLLYINYTSVITSDFLSQHPNPKGKEGFLLDGEDRPEKVGWRKKSCFLEFTYVDVARDFIIIVISIIISRTIVINLC